ncbi:hypothetical protein H4S14_004317 [Agrobacterium vitis]|nr:hypothetical protein [Agrobacterium vitis]MBE1440537.1 hypothetical protein [Agrobacterium vitis]
MPPENTRKMPRVSHLSLGRYRYGSIFWLMAFAKQFLRQHKQKRRCAQSRAAIRQLSPQLQDDIGVRNGYWINHDF